MGPGSVCGSHGAVEGDEVVDVIVLSLEGMGSGMRVPEVRYARSGDLRLAYQQWGDGPPLMIIPDLISNCEITWEHESYRRTDEHLGKHMSCVYFDKRGIGMSDRFDSSSAACTRSELALPAAGRPSDWRTSGVFGVDAEDHGADSISSPRSSRTSLAATIAVTSLTSRVGFNSTTSAPTTTAPLAPIWRSESRSCRVDSPPGS